jgi:cysteinyl-tRNA synthetase
MTLKLYNTLTRTKEAFAPIDPANVRMYVCGPTVYDFAHIGNARPVIVFDVLYRLLRHLYGESHVKYVRNITDVDDKINARAAERGVSIRDLTEETYANFKQDVAALGCLPPTVEPRATDYVSRPDAPIDMIRLIQKLIANGNAYAAEAHVLFSVPSMPDYGQLSRRPLDEMIAGARVDVAPYKKNPMDFVLWKPSRGDEPGWDSPWGRGRPGWHIECSAMAAAHLGETFDIHGGGIDLVFPHHENEIAQSRCAFHAPIMAKTWMHNGFLQVEGEKMAKSTGNFVTIRELLADWPGEVLRFNMLRTHYRQPIDWTIRGVGESFDSYFDLLETAENYLPTAPDRQVVESLFDDLNTPSAFSWLHELRASAHRRDIEAGGALSASLNLLGLAGRPREVGTVMPTLRHGNSRDQIVDGLLGLFEKNLPVGRAWKIIDNSSLDNLEDEAKVFRDRLRFVDNRVYVADVVRLNERIEEINRWIEARLIARKAKNFAEADRIRDELLQLGIVLKDGKDPNTGEPRTTWEPAR